MKVNDLKLNAVDTQKVADYNKIPNGQFISVGYRKYDGRAKQGYKKETKQGGAYIEAVWNNVQKGVEYSAYARVKQHIEQTGEALKPRLNVVQIEDCKGLEYNTKTQNAAFFAPGVGIKLKEGSKTYHIPDATQADGYRHNVTEAEYKAYIASFGLTTEVSKSDSKRGVDVRLFTVRNVFMLNGINY